jgi:D-alanine-D-alanine ligase
MEKLIRNPKLEVRNLYMFNKNESSELRVAVLMGGPSREREISLRSGKAVSEALKRKGYPVIEFTEMDHLAHDLEESKINVAFIALHGRFGEDGGVQQVLEDCKIPYTGSDPKASYLAMHKDLAKQEFEKAGLMTAPWCSGAFESLEKIETASKNIGFPVVLKPVAEGSSIGLEIVEKLEDLSNAFDRIQKISNQILIEKFVEGAELTVGILGEVPLPVVQVKTERAFYDYDAKYSPGHTEYEVPAQLSSQIAEKVQEIGLKAHRSLGCRDMSRVDILLDRDRIPWVLEVNTIPGFTERSLLPKAAFARGILFEDLCEKILIMALKRTVSNASSKTVRL